MALNFVGSGDEVDVGSNAILDDMLVGTLCAWVKLPTSGTSSAHFIYEKNGTAKFTFWCDVSNNDVEFIIDRATTDLNVRATTGQGLAQGVWRFIAYSWNLSLTDGDQHMYWGAQSIPVREFGYALQQVGTGAIVTNNTGPGKIGNQAGGFRNFVGDIAWVGIWNRQLSLRECEGMRRQVQATAGNVGFWHLGWESAATRQLDQSGWGNHGTVTTVTRSQTPDFLRPVKGWRSSQKQMMEEPAAATDTVDRWMGHYPFPTPRREIVAY